MRQTARFLLGPTVLTEKEKTFKRRFFATYAQRLAGPCGCHDVLPEHLRINHPEMTQELIELMNALRKYGLLGDISISRLARILNCTLCSHYSPTGLQNRLKATPPELEYIDLFVKALAREIRKNNTPTKNKR